MGLKVEFRQSNKTVEWDDSLGSILELAGEHGIEIESECEQGVCGTCKTKLISGEVEMETEDGLDDTDLEENMILLCVSVPKTDVVIEA
jgi:ferredoxin